MKKSFWLNFFLICVGIVLGAMLADLVAGSAALSWLAYGLDFGTAAPFVLEMNVFTLTIGFSVKITVATILCVALSLVLGRLIVKR